ncbi:MAG: CAP domain-containing protein, partial [Chitinophagales bacterium]|nr:CAP domain-containing protein [Hyphomicrobiales bacterium]
ASDEIGLMAAKFNPAEAQNAINVYRAKKGLGPLKLNAKLTQAAKMHAQDLAKNDRISHFGSDGSDIEERTRRTGYVFNLIAENVGTGQRTPAEVIKGWQQSPSHNENLLLADADEMGVAVVYRPETEFQTFWTLVLGSGRG